MIGGNKPLVGAVMLLGLFTQGQATANSKLPEGKGVELVQAHCSACHSLALITQNRMTRDRWLDTIRWMQETQGLWPLGEQEPVILDYLAKHFAPVATGRRPALPSHLMPPSN